MAAEMEVQIWSDVVCPWCYLGKRRFEQALAGFDERGSRAAGPVIPSTHIS